MRVLLSVLGALGGLAAFLTALWFVVRAIIRETQAVEDNTKALTTLTDEVKRINLIQTSHGERIATLEGWRKRDGAVH